MSALVPETPRRPACLLTRSLTSVGDMPRSSNKKSGTPGSRSPLLVPITSPPVGVKPMVVSTPTPPRTAAMLAPLPRFATAQLLHHVLVGETVETVADDALLCELPRKRVEPGDAGHPAVECGVEASHLRDRRVGPAHGLDCCDCLRKMVGVDRHQCPEIGDQIGGDPLRLAVAVPAVDDPVPSRRQVVPVEPPISQPTHQGVERGGVIRQIIPALVEGLAAGVSEAQAAPTPDSARLRPQLQGLRRVLPQAVQGGLQAGRTSVDRQQPLCAHDALHLSRSGTRFYTGYHWWVTWL